jgi:hypothetical protein
MYALDPLNNFAVYPGLTRRLAVRKFFRFLFVHAHQSDGIASEFFVHDAFQSLTWPLAFPSRKLGVNEVQGDLECLRIGPKVEQEKGCLAVL